LLGSISVRAVALGMNQGTLVGAFLYNFAVFRLNFL